jgi:hypothetical protein
MCRDHNWEGKTHQASVERQLGGESGSRKCGETTGWIKWTKEICRELEVNQTKKRWRDNWVGKVDHADV